MTIEQITRDSLLCRYRAIRLIEALAIKLTDEFHIKKMMEYAELGLSDMEIITKFCNNRYWLNEHKLT